MEKKFLLTLDNEFIEYCRVNNIQDVEKFGKELFQKAFTELKYGKVPVINLKTETKVVETKVTKIETEIVRELGEPEIVIPKEIRKEAYDALRKELKKNNLYDE